MMKAAVVVAAALAASSAFAENPRAVRGETIIIQGTAPPRVPPKAKKRYHRIAPAYSDTAILQDRWAKAWVLLDIDERGSVARVKLLKKPGYDLDQIAIDRAFSMRFDPAEDMWGNATRSQLIVPIEWPSYWWLVAREGVTTKVPDYIDRVPCANSGRPMKVGSIHPAYRDCSPPPDLETIKNTPWIERR